MNANKFQALESAPMRYAVAALLFLFAFLARFLLLPHESGYPFITFYPVMVACFYFCGIGPSLWFVVVSALTADYYFIPPIGSLGLNAIDRVAISMYLVSAALVGMLVQYMHRKSDQLRLSEQRYYGLLNDQTEIICRLKPDGTITYVNQAFCRLFGQSENETIGHTWHVVAHEEDIPLINQKLSTLSPEHNVVTIENRVFDSSGNIHWMQFVNRAFFNEAGQIIETHVVGRDITERKQIEQSLRRADEKSYMLLRNASDGIQFLTLMATSLKPAIHFVPC